MASGLSFSLRLSAGVQRLLNRGPEELQAEMGERLGLELLDQGQEVIRAAKILVPYDTGELSASARAELLYASPLSMGVHLSFGGDPGSGNVDGESNSGEVEYAVIQHEDMALQHPNGGQAKYLETPWLDAQPRKRAGHVAVMREVLERHDLA